MAGVVTPGKKDIYMYMYIYIYIYLFIYMYIHIYIYIYIINVNLQLQWPRGTVRLAKRQQDNYWSCNKIICNPRRYCTRAHTVEVVNIERATSG